jgi:uncharacterized membrane protein
MDIVPILSAVVLTATLATLVLGVLSYVAFRARDRRRPAANARTVATRRFLVRYEIPGDGEQPPRS